VWIEQGYFKVFPNLYCVLVGPAGNRKTSAMSIAKQLLRELKSVPFSAESVTKEKLVMDMFEQERIIGTLPEQHKAQNTYSPMTIMVTELSEFLGPSSIGMINFLTTIYDQDFYECRTKNKGDVLITGPYLNLLACTTPEWITTYLRTDVISGGFSRRAIFVLETDKAGRIPFPEVTPQAKAAWQRVVEHAQRLAQVAGPFIWDPAAKAFYSDWYKNLEMPKDETIIGYYETKHMQLLKISMLLALSEETDRILRTHHLQAGLELLKLAEENLLRVFQGIGRNELNAAAQKVLDLFDRLPTKTFRLGTEEVTCPTIPEKDLRAVMFKTVDQQELDKVLTHLIDTDLIGRGQLSQGGVLRTFLFRKPKKLLS